MMWAPVECLMNDGCGNMCVTYGDTGIGRRGAKNLIFLYVNEEGFSKHV